MSNQSQAKLVARILVVKSPGASDERKILHIRPWVTFFRSISRVINWHIAWNIMSSNLALHFPGKELLENHTLHTIILATDH